jgi:hypothetical protein
VSYDNFRRGCVPSGVTMAGWYPGWQLVLAWLVVTVVAGVFYFAPVTRLIGSLSD